MMIFWTIISRAFFLHLPWLSELLGLGENVMEIHREIWNNEVLRPELPLSLFNSKALQSLQQHGCSKWNWPQVHKSQNLYKEVFHKTWYLKKKKKIWRRWDHLLGLSAVSVRPLYQLEEKHHQIRAYILLIKVIAVRHHQIRVAFCQVDSITAVRHLVRGFPQSKTLVSRFFPLQEDPLEGRSSLSLYVVPGIPYQPVQGVHRINVSWDWLQLLLPQRETGVDNGWMDLTTFTT